MDVRKLLTGLVTALLFAGITGVAEDKSTPPDVPLRITVVFNEYDGSKKITSLPYEMPCKSSIHGGSSALQMGFRVPFKTKQDEVQLHDVGTHIDCKASLPDEHGNFLVELGVEHNAVYAPADNAGKTEWRPGTPLADDPVFGEIQAHLPDLSIHDGQTVQALVATDPVSGHVWKVEATLNVVK